METQHTPVEVFYISSDSLDDAPLAKQLEDHLSVCRRKGLISTWHKGLIDAGSEQQKELDRHLNAASLILLLVSSDFLASDYCYETLLRALQQHKAKAAQVIPILLRPCDWQSAPFAKAELEVLPTGRQPITIWSDQDVAWTNVVMGIRQALGDPLEDEERYRRKMVETYQWPRFTNFARSDLSLATMPLEKVFVRLTRSVEPEHVPAEQPGLAEQGERLQQKPIIVQEPIGLGQALNGHLLIVGEPGSGKSTLLRWLAVTYAQKRQRESDRLGSSADADRLPVLVELKHLPDRYLKPGNNEKIYWHQMIVEYLTTEWGFTDMSPQLLTDALNSGRCLLLLDGLDEVADNSARCRLVEALNDQLVNDTLGKNRVIVTSRPSASTGLRVDRSPAGASRNGQPGFWECHIERFTPDDVRQFFRSWYAPPDGEPTAWQLDEADKLYKRVQDTLATLGPVTTPLMCIILLRIGQRGGNLPTSRVKVYERCCDDLIEKWEAAHNVAYRGSLEEIGSGSQLHLLASVAYFMHYEGKTEITRIELIERLTESFEKIDRYSYDKAFQEAERFQKILSLRSGLLQVQGDETYGFSHLVFQEYLAAHYIAAQPNFIDLVMANLHEAWWREVHLILLASLGSGSKQDQDKAAELIRKILNVYAPPSWILRSTKNRWWREHGPGKLLPQIQLERRIAWMLDRELELAVRGYAECTPDGMAATGVSNELSERATALVWHTLNDDARYVARETLLTIAGQLFRHGNTVVIRTLREALHKPERKVQGMAADILKELKEDEVVVVSDLRTPLHNPDRDKRRQTATGLGQAEASHEEVVRGLLAALRDTNGYVRLQAAASLGKVGMGNKEVVSALLAALRDTDEFVRRMVALSLGQVGEGNEEVVGTLLAFLDDPKVSVRIQAAESLGKVGTGNEKGTGILLAALYDPVVNKQVRVRVAGILGKAGNQAGVDALLAALRGPDMNVRFQAAESLEQVGKVNQAGVDALVVALRDPDRNVRHQAALRLGNIGMGKERTTSGLLAALRDPDRNVRHQAALSLGQMGASNEEVTKALLAALRNPKWHVRDWAALYLGRLEIKEEIQLRGVLVALNGRLHDEDSNVRQTALMAIRQLLDGRPIPATRSTFGFRRKNIDSSGSRSS